MCLFGLSRVTFEHDPEKLFRSKRFDPKQFDADIAHLDRTILVVVEGENLMTPEGVDSIRKVALGASELEGVEAVYSMLSVRDRRRVGRYLLPLFPSLQASPERFEQAGLYCNAQMGTRLLKKFCPLDRDSLNVLEKAIETLGLSARAYHRILKISRTIADLEGALDIQSSHVAEAIQYRSLDRTLK